MILIVRTIKQAGQKLYAAAFETSRSRSHVSSKEQDKIAALEAKLKNRNEVLAEIVEELVRTKKELWGN